ncbi:StAR-related lipid transfer protein 9, putative [Theobroma cacao]|uniref:StAR-related lipid transfer protein 9, putative n=1 Tax=Theobroma cacao TaxID=3641 RepID=A0A061DUJ9_THECC|nr:StAR-related lipid transfer protein 9, putative [Theobroma cacao]
MEVEESGGDGDRPRVQSHWYWATASVAQFGWAVSSYRKGYAGDHRLMPMKTFAVASLFLGASASASVAFLNASGIHKVEDLMEVGAGKRTGLGIRPMAGDE